MMILNLLFYELNRLLSNYFETSGENTSIPRVNFPDFSTQILNSREKNNERVYLSP